MKSQGLMVSERGKVILQEFDVPAPGQGEVILEAEYSTMSPGTERTIILGISRPPPVNLGYSFAGRVHTVGANVAHLKIGDPVVTTGRHASYIVADARFVTPVPECVDLEQAAFFNLAHTALYGVRQARVQLGEAVAVIGQGLVGLITARLAQIAGAVPVIAIDIDEGRLELSRRLGIQEAINGTESAQLQRLIQSLPGGGVPVAIDATGVCGSVEMALDIIGVRGRVVLLGSVQGDEAISFHRKLSRKGASLIGAYVNSKPWSLFQTNVETLEWPPALAPGHRRYVGPDMWTSDEDVRVVMNLIKYGVLDMAPLITHRFTPDQAPAAYQLVTDQDRSLVGGVICWK